MSIDIKVPTLPESISDATVLDWHIAVGDFVARGDNLVDLEIMCLIILMNFDIQSTPWVSFIQFLS